MFKKMLVPTDGSDLSNRAARAAIEFAKDNGSAIVGLSVAEISRYFPISLISGGGDFTLLADSIRQQARDNVEIIKNLAEKAGVPCEVHTTESGNPSDEILTAAQTYGCDSIFMASHGRTGLDKLLLGSQAQKVLVYSKIPVIVFR
ncbi:universal stress protein [Herbaspirillum sp. RV1423]|uniref:universal stress protein n=1 Tax=Herbaspirillum sp. RV1423 TaxID=1443993 RepID=UPI0005570A48|nr:universal stress protein [Herbaspirillum sp. RV1423]